MRTRPYPGWPASVGDMVKDDKRWSVEDHLRDAPPEHVALYRLIEDCLLGLDGVTLSVSKTTITFKGRRRGFAGARPTLHGVNGKSVRLSGKTRREGRTDQA